MRFPVAVVALVAVAGFAGLNALAFSHAEAMLRFSDSGPRTTTPEHLGLLSRMKVLLAGVSVPRPTSHRRASELDPDCRVLSVPGPSGIRLASWYCNRGGGTPLIILFHGYSAEKTSLLREARALLDLGSSVMLVDFRGSGGSSESYTTVGVHEAEDVAAAVRYARWRLSHRKIFLFGRSMGAAAILRAVHAHAVQPDGVILEAVFDTLLNTVRNRFRAMRVPSFPSAELLVFWGGQQWGFDGFGHNPSEYAASVHCPALLMHGERDSRVGLAEARRVFDAISGTKEFVTFEQSGHESYLSSHGNQWRSAVERFIERTGKPASWGPPASSGNTRRNMGGIVAGRSSTCAPGRASGGPTPSPSASRWFRERRTTALRPGRESQTPWSCRASDYGRSGIWPDRPRISTSGHLWSFAWITSALASGPPSTAEKMGRSDECHPESERSPEQEASSSSGLASVHDARIRAKPSRDGGGRGAGG